MEAPTPLVEVEQRQSTGVAIVRIGGDTDGAG